MLLKFICKIGSGGTAPQMQEEYAADGVTFIKASNLDSIIENQNENKACKITKESVQRHKYKQYPQGTILFAKSGLSCTKNRVYVTKDSSYIVNHLCALVVTSPQIDSEWLALFIKHYNVTKLIKDESYPSISLQSIGMIDVPTVSLKKQIEISTAIQKIKDGIEEKKKQLDQLDLLIKSRFNEMFDALQPNIPFGSVASIVRGASPRPISRFLTDKPEGVNWIKIGDTDSDSIYVTRTSEKVTAQGALKSRHVSPGDFILSNSMSFGRPYILKISGCVHDGWLIVSNYQGSFDPIFLYYLLRSPKIQIQFDAAADGSTVRNLNSDKVKKVLLLVPKKSEQVKFAECAKLIDKSKFVVHSKYFL
jgi:restriction endonuclease S subunit